VPKAETQERMERIWATVRDIPEGSVASYGQIAALAGIPRGARQVGYALRHLPDGSGVPWHRVVTASGRLAFEQGSPAWKRQKGRLAEEDVPVQGGRINMSKYRWQPQLDELLWKPSALWDREVKG
jgi:methylated-DNA-protein-cysteine methyltransferase related protein